MKSVWKGLLILSILFFTLLAICVILIGVANCPYNPQLRSRPYIDYAKFPFKTGDLILTHSKGLKLSGVPFVRNVPLHAALIWVHPQLGPLIVEMRWDPNDFIKHRDILTDEFVCAGLCVMRLSDYLQAFQGVACVRPLKRGIIDSASIDKAISSWARHQPFDYLLGIFNVPMVTGLVLSPGFKGLSNALLKRVPMFDEKGERLRGRICSEMVVNLLQHGGAIPADADAYRWTPAMLSSAHPILNATANARGFEWGEELLIKIT